MIYIAREVREGDFLIQYGSRVVKINDGTASKHYNDVVQGRTRVTFELADGQSVSYDPEAEVATTSRKPMA